MLKFDLSSVVRNIAGPSNPHGALPVSELAARGISGKVENEPGLMPDGAVIIAAITSCTNTNNPRNMIAAGLLARNANALGLTRKPWVEDLAGAGLEGGARCTWKKPGCCRNWSSWASASSALPAPPATACAGALDPVIQKEIVDRDLYATAVLSGNRNFDGRIHPYAKQAFLASPPLVVAYAIAGTIRFDIEKDVLGIDAGGKPVRLKDIWPSDDEIDAVVAAQREARAVPQGLRRRCSRSGRRRRGSAAAVRLAPAEHLHPPPAVLGRRAGRRAQPGGHARRWRCWATTSPPTTCRRRTPSCWTAPPANTWRRWACRKRTSIPTPPTAATT